MYRTEKPCTPKILDLIKQTWSTKYLSIKDGYQILKFDTSNIVFVDSVDGIGTKARLHWKFRTFKEAVIDALAMNLNDLALLRAVPFKLQNHITLPDDDEQAILEIIRNLVNECKKREIVITAGETSIHLNGDFDISVTLTGIAETFKQNEFKSGDVLIGIESSGLHSNGFTKVREIFNEEKLEFTIPTHIYIGDILNLNNKFDIHGMAHITGGAYTKIKQFLNNVDILIKKDHELKPHNVFYELYKKGLSDEEMYKTFNCGIGFILSVPREQANDVVSNIKSFKSCIIGKVVKGEGKVFIESMFSSKQVVL